MLSFLKEDNIFKLFLLAILLRILIIPFFFHPDIKTYNFQSSFLRDGVLNIYAYLDSHKQNLPLKEDFVYFPLTYFFLGGYQVLASPFLGSQFEAWLNNASSLSSQDPLIFRYLFILKFPYLILDMATAFLLINLVAESEKKRVFYLWMFNPFSIAIIYLYSNIDIISVFLTVLSLFYLKKKKIIFSALSLGLGAGFKAFPLLFLPFMLFSLKDLKDRIIYSAVSLGLFGLVILPYIFTGSFGNATLASGLTTVIFTPSISLIFGENLMLTVVLLSILVFMGFYEKSRVDVPIKYLLAALLLIYSSIHYHIQWLLWIIPFVIIFLSNYNKFVKPLLLLGIVAVVIPLLYDDKYMSVSLLTPLSSYYSILPDPFLIINKIYNASVLQGILHSILLGGSLLIVWLIFTREKYEDS